MEADTETVAARAERHRYPGGASHVLGKSQRFQFPGFGRLVAGSGWNTRAQKNQDRMKDKTSCQLSEITPDR